MTEQSRLRTLFIVMTSIMWLVDRFVPTLCVLAFYAYAYAVRKFAPRFVTTFNNFVMWIFVVSCASLPFFLAVIPYFTLRFVNARAYIKFGCFLQREKHRPSVD